MHDDSSVVFLSAESGLTSEGGEERLKTQLQPPCDAKLWTVYVSGGSRSPASSPAVSSICAIRYAHNAAGLAKEICVSVPGSCNAARHTGWPALSKRQRRIR